MKCHRCGKDNPAEIHTCAPLALKLADLLRTEGLDQGSTVRMDAAAELRRLHAELHQWKSVFGHLGTADECGNEWIGLQDQAERDTALLRQCLEALEICNPYPAAAEVARSTAIAALKERLK